MIIAAWLAQGQGDRVEALLGLHEPVVEGHVRRMRELLARGFYVLLRSHAREDVKERAVDALALTGAREASRIRGWLAAPLPHLAARLGKRLNHRALQGRAKKTEPGEIAGFLREAVAKASGGGS